MKALNFRVQNFKNVDDSGWIPLERVTAFVGRNESGKTALLKALHKFNPATSEPYDPQREFPRDRYTKDFGSQGSDGGDWPVCSVVFELDGTVKDLILEILEEDDVVPDRVTATRYYDGSLHLEFEPLPEEENPSLEPVLIALTDFSKGARRLPAAEGETEEGVAERRQELLTWADKWTAAVKTMKNLRDATTTKKLATFREQANGKSSPDTADMVEGIIEALTPILDHLQKPPLEDQLCEIVEAQLPVFIYFENYGILDSAIWLPRFIEDLKNRPNDPKVRTIRAMFRHVRLDPSQVAELGSGGAERERHSGNQPSEEAILADERLKDERAIKLNSASIDITKRFSEWWSQRRHKIRYHADGAYFRIWIADDRRPDVEIELEERSKGFQWFFSFYLVFLVESEDGHKDAILLLDEPGLDLHPTAQQELITFFENLAESNQLVYTTHSPFLIDGENIQRVRPVTEDSDGRSWVSIGEWPKDRETIFPLQAAAGYAMVRGLFQHRRNVLVEGMSDLYYLHALSHQCRRANRVALPEEIYVTACGGTKLVGQFASLFMGQGVRPLVLLDGDEAGKVRRDALLKDLYCGHMDAIMMLDDVLGRSGEQLEIEDILGEDIIIPALSSVLGKPLKLNAADRDAGSLPAQIKAAARRKGIELPEGWKASVAIELVSEWAEKKTILPDPVLERAERLFAVISTRFPQGVV
jgi:energy-coupling factor transporter ATP-binding protein EcfA2